MPTQQSICGHNSFSIHVHTCIFIIYIYILFYLLSVEAQLLLDLFLLLSHHGITASALYQFFSLFKDKDIALVSKRLRTYIEHDLVVI